MISLEWNDRESGRQRETPIGSRSRDFRGDMLAAKVRREVAPQSGAANEPRVRRVVAARKGPPAAHRGSDRPVV
jgi:hypothetical protein